MNWTGGSLTSSRKARNSVIATQKQHFANARKNLYHTAQASLDLDFTLFEPNARITKRRLAQQTPLQAWEVESEEDANQQLAQPTLNREERSPSKSGYSNHARDDSNTTMEPTSPTANQYPKANDTAATPAEDDDDNDEFETKKKELLAMRDWCGLESTRPVRMKFEDPSDREMIAKRRHRRGVDKTKTSCSSSSSPEKHIRHRHRHHHYHRHLSKSSSGRPSHPPPPRINQHSPRIRSDGFSELERDGN